MDLPQLVFVFFPAWVEASTQPRIVIGRPMRRSTLPTTESMPRERRGRRRPGRGSVPIAITSFFTMSSRSTREPVREGLDCLRRREAMGGAVAADHHDAASSACSSFSVAQAAGFLLIDRFLIEPTCHGLDRLCRREGMGGAVAGALPAGHLDAAAVVALPAGHHDAAAIPSAFSTSSALV